MIGDDLVRDIAGGNAAGLRTIWPQPRRRPELRSFVGPAPHFTVDSVAEADAQHSSRSGPLNS